MSPDTTTTTATAAEGEDHNTTTVSSKMRDDDHENHNLVVPRVKFSENSKNLMIESGEEYTCGLLSFRPGWMQSLANKQTFLVIFSLTSILQGMFFTYFVSVLTTIEKLYQMQSRTTGVIMSATEIGQIGGALLLTYYGGQGNRPKWIAAGMLVFAAASLLCATPHFLFGGQSLLSAHPLPTSSSGQLYHVPERADFSQSLCLVNGSSSSRLTHQKCEDEELKSAQSQVTTWVLSIFFVSLFLIGIGVTAVNTLAIPYIDDNVAPRESPLYFGQSSSLFAFPVF